MQLRGKKSELGQSMIMFTFMLTGLMGLVAMTLDVGLAYRERQSAQAAADAAALAAAGVLKSGGTVAEAEARALEIAGNNGYSEGVDGVTIEVAIPPDAGSHVGQDGFARVRIDRPVGAQFAKVLDISAFQIYGQATAGSVLGEDPPAPPRALFSLDTNCGAFNIGISASEVDVIGGVHSNSEVEVSGSYNEFTGGDNTYVCSFKNGGSNNTYDPPFASSGALEDPLRYVWSDVPCTVTFTTDTDLASVNSVWVNDDPNSNQLKPGVYCSTKKLSLSKQGAYGTVTFVAQGQISISGSDFNLQPYWEQVLLFTTFDDDSAMDLSGSNGLWGGYIYAPNGKAKLNGSDNLTVQGAVVAEKIDVSGGGLTIDSTQFANDGGTLPGPLRLVE